MIPEEYVKYGLYGAAGLGLLVELPNIKLGMPPATNITLRNTVMKRPNMSLACKNMTIVHETSTKLKTRGTVNPNHHTKELHPRTMQSIYICKHTEHRIHTNICSRL
jgi:hypothetical protein